MQVRGPNASGAPNAVMPPATALKTDSTDANSARLLSTPRFSRVHPPGRQAVCVEPGQSRAASYVCRHDGVPTRAQTSNDGILRCACTWRLGLVVNLFGSTAAIMRIENLRMSIRMIINASGPSYRTGYLSKPPSHALRASKCPLSLILTSNPSVGSATNESHAGLCVPCPLCVATISKPLWIS